MRTEFEKTDTSCSTWTGKDWDGIQDVCQPQGNASNYGMKSATGKVYVKWNCSATLVQKSWYSDSGCTELLGPPEGPSPSISTLACSYSDFHRTYVTYACSQSYPAARWSRYADSSCQSKDEAMPQEIVPLNFCRAGGWERDNKGKATTCGSAGLITTLWQNSDCTGTSSWVKSDATISRTCAPPNGYYHSHHKIESGCLSASNDEGRQRSAIPIVSLGLAVGFWLGTSHTRL